jgi:hypothetical protein
VPLRPLGVGELLDGALGLIRSNPRTVLGLAAAISAVSAVLETIGLWASYAIVGDPAASAISSATDQAALEAQLTTTLAASAVQLVPALMAGLLQVVASGLFVVLVGAAVLGRKLDASQTWALLRPRMLGLIGLSVLIGVAGLASMAAIVGIVIGLGMAAGGWGVLAGLAIALAGSLTLLYAYVRLSLAPATLVIESRSPGAAMGRSWRLVRGSFWRVLGITLLATIIVSVLSTVVTVPFLTVATVATATLEASWPVVLATGVASLFSGIVTLPFSAAVTGLLYTDLRIRREALDIELISAGVDPSGDPLAPYRRINS